MSFHSAQRHPNRTWHRVDPQNSHACLCGCIGNTTDSFNLAAASVPVFPLCATRLLVRARLAFDFLIPFTEQVVGTQGECVFLSTTCWRVSLAPGPKPQYHHHHHHHHHHHWLMLRRVSSSVFSIFKMGKARRAKWDCGRFSPPASTTSQFPQKRAGGHSQITTQWTTKLTGENGRRHKLLLMTSWLAVVGVTGFLLDYHTVFLEYHWMVLFFFSFSMCIKLHQTYKTDLSRIVENWHVHYVPSFHIKGSTTSSMNLPIKKGIDCAVK